MIGLIGAMEEEIAILRGLMKNVRAGRDALCPGFEFFSGLLEGKEVVLLQSGIGKVQAAAGCAVLIWKFRPLIVINTGCAGGVNPEGSLPLNFGDAVISSALAYHDFDIRDFGYRIGQVPGRDSQFFSAKETLVKSCEAAVWELQSENRLPGNFRALPGLICSGDVFVSDSGRVREILGHFPAARAIEMEGAAIAHTCALFNVPFLVIRCLSDIAGEESPVKFDEFLPVAAKNSSEIVRRLVSKL